MQAFNINSYPWLQRKRALPIIAAIGVLITVLIIKLQPTMVNSDQQQVAKAVNVIEVNRHIVRPEIVGYGTVKPDLILKAMAEVSGRVTYVHPELKKGAFIAKDTLIATIDDKDYQLALKQAQADLLAAKASLKEMELTIANNQLELKLSNEKLRVGQAELGRLAKLSASGTISASRLDQEKQAVLVQQQEVQKLENQRTTLPSELAVLTTKIDIAKAKYQQSERDLARTQIFLPFSGRISDVFIEKEQFVAKGNNMFDAVGMEKITINAQFPIDQFGRFVADLNRSSIDLSIPKQTPVMSELLASLGLSAKVSIAGENFEGWQARVERFSDNLDLQSRTVGVIVSVSNGYSQIKPGVRPPLLEGMYMKVSLLGQRGDFLALPRFALRDNQVFKVSKDNTLTRVTLNNPLLQDSLALLPVNANTENQQAMPIVAGDKIVVSDLFPAVNGMALAPVVDVNTQQQLTHWLEQAQ